MKNFLKILRIMFLNECPMTECKGRVLKYPVGMFQQGEYKVVRRHICDTCHEYLK